MSGVPQHDSSAPPAAAYEGLPAAEEGLPAADVEAADGGVPERTAGAEASETDGGDPVPESGAAGARRSAAWASPGLDAPPAGPTLSFGFNLAKVPDHGEDSDPIVRHGRELGLVAVFDGMGGAGGTVYETPEGPRTGAYLASRAARDVVEERMLALLDPEWNHDGPAVACPISTTARSSTRSVTPCD